MRMVLCWEIDARKVEAAEWRLYGNKSADRRKYKDPA